jgi:hypothetical protein
MFLRDYCLLVLSSGVRGRHAGLLVPLVGGELFRLCPGLSRPVVSIRVSKIASLDGSPGWLCDNAQVTGRRVEAG